MESPEIPKKRNKPNDLYEAILPNGQDTGYIELIRKEKFTERLIQFSKNFINSSQKIYKKNEEEIRFFKALLGMKFLQDGFDYFKNYPNQEEHLINTKNLKLKYCELKSFLMGEQISDIILQVYIEFLRENDKVIAVSEEEFKTIRNKGINFSWALKIIILTNAGVAVVEKKQKKIMWFLKYNKENTDFWGFEGFRQEEYVRDWNNDQMLSIIRKVYLGEELGDEIEVPEGFRETIFKDILSKDIKED